MPYGYYALGSEAYGGIPLASQRAVLPPYLLGQRDANRRLVAVVELDLWDWANGVTDTRRFSTRPADTSAIIGPDGAQIEARLAGQIEVVRAFSIGDGGLYGGRVETTLSAIEIANGDGALDALLRTHTFDGRSARILVGPLGTDALGLTTPPAWGDLTLVCRALMGQPRRTDDLMSVALIDVGVTLRDPLQLMTFGGTGGADGSAEIKGLTLAYIGGQVVNIPLQELDSATFTYHVAVGPIERIQAVRVAGVAVPIAADYPTYSDLPAPDAMTPGTCVTSVAGTQAVVRFQAEQTGTITCDALGDNGVEEPYDDGTLYDDGRGYDSTRIGAFGVTLGHVMRRMLVRLGRLPADEMDDATFAYFDTLNQDAIGFFLPVGQDLTLDDALAALAAGAGATVGPDRLGRYGLRRIDPPSTQAAFAFGEGDALALEHLELTNVPPWAWEVGHLRVWRVQGGSDLAPNAGASARRLYGQEWRKVTATDTAIKRRHRASQRAPFVAGPYLAETPARRTLDRLMDIFRPGRERFKFEAMTALFLLDVGKVVSLTDRRHGLEAGRALLAEEVRDIIAPDGRGYTVITGLG